MRNEDEFSGMSSEEIRAGALAIMRGTPETPAEDQKQLAADRLRVQHVMSIGADKATPEDREFLRLQIQATLRGGLL